MDLANAPLDAARGGLEWAYSNRLNMPWRTLSEQAMEYITAHPGSTVIQIASALIAVWPGVLASPILTSVGFSNIGPVAGETSLPLALDSNVTDTTRLGSAAASYQSMYGATWAFSGMQSAAMQGYALPVVQCFVQGASVGSAGVVELLKRR